MTPLNQIKKKLSALRDAASEVYVAAVEAMEEVERLEKQQQQPCIPVKTQSAKDRHKYLLENNNWGRGKKTVKVKL